MEFSSAHKTLKLSDGIEMKQNGNLSITGNGDIKLNEAALKELGFIIQWSEDGTVGTLTKIKEGHVVLSGEEIAFAAMAAEFTELISEVARKIYDHPQMAFTETYACELLCEVLSSQGFEVERNLRGVNPDTKDAWIMDTAFTATLKGNASGPTIAILLEYDALPDGHACGHNLIASAGLSAALMLAKQMGALPGKLIVYGTPGEEGKAGKAHMVEAGLFDGVDVALATHPGDRWATGSDFLATKTATIVFKGVPSHASAAPEKGISALDAAVIAYNAIELQREHLRSDARVHGFIRDGGKVTNVVPDRAEMDWGVRALDNVYMEKLADMIERCARAGALATGAEMEISWSVTYGAPVKVEALDTMVIRLAEALTSGLVKPFDVLGSSDVGNVSFVLPTCNLWFGITPEGVMPHTKEFLAASGASESIPSVLTAGTVIALAARRLFMDREMVENYKEAFTLSKQKLIAQG
ncbi:M20 family metallopeptidase [Acidaminobacter hydrogenoformans]|uniref:Amidohydrolase n=1 Tax=Acidaminobacter hydrogenoformans DSM 2784 TaxID=1120920 RepID=A0A1G5S1E2_9FIRM|nr:M20 family metallopeptidase [Acidaminobacter hydrogenoformans]SCZ80184.1 amidohydrolase [Acidaminobacter hydrogenoformans DSM 2784]